MLKVRKGFNRVKAKTGKFHPRTGWKPKEEVKVKLYSLSLISALGEVGSGRHAPAALPPSPMVQKAGWVRSGRVWQFLPPTGIRSPDRPARSQSLYLLSYPVYDFKWDMA